MKDINSPEELYQELTNISTDNSVSQFTIPGKGKFTLVYQESDENIAKEIESDEDLKKLIHENLAAYEKGDYQTTSELLKSLSKEK